MNADSIAMMHYCSNTCSVVLPRGVRHCPIHARAPWGSAQPVKRITGRKLQRLRKQLFDKQPLCVVCQAQGRVRIATIRDHVINLAAGGQDIASNVQALCQACSDAKTQVEALRGRTRP